MSQTERPGQQDLRLPVVTPDQIQEALPLQRVRPPGHAVGTGVEILGLSEQLQGPGIVIEGQMEVGRGQDQIRPGQGTQGQRVDEAGSGLEILDPRRNRTLPSTLSTPALV